uniref:C-type lectin domain-containing protein n=1 Tax=Acrobeloides nanus TaxID=290746 RepID=A0A914BZA2_9BILA
MQFIFAISICIFLIKSTISEKNHWPAFYPCDYGYTYEKTLKQCYKLYAGGDLTFDLAEAKCNEDDAHLVSIHSEKENEYVTALAYTNGGASSGCQWINAWIGLHYLNEAWRWTDETPLDYTKWGCNLPAKGKKTCAFTNTAHASEPSCGDWYGLWDNHHYCNESRAFVICKQHPKLFG